MIYQSYYGKDRNKVGGKFCSLTEMGSMQISLLKESKYILFKLFKNYSPTFYFIQRATNLE